ncbi:MAG: hypothetical protein ACWGOX_01465 [Desulforhopalus sp.]
MITYLYWTAVIFLAALVFIIFAKTEKWKFGTIVALVILAIGWNAYYFRFQQIFVKRYGGVMTIEVPKGLYHMGATWKDDNLWIENYNAETNSCIFTEYSKGNLLQGKVTLKNCNPLLPR